MPKVLSIIGWVVVDGTTKKEVNSCHIRRAPTVEARHVLDLTGNGTANRTMKIGMITIDIDIIIQISESVLSAKSNKSAKSSA